MASTNWKSGVTQAPLPPKVRGLPWLGSALQMKQDPLQFLVSQSKTYGPIFRIEAAGHAFTVLAGPLANTFASREGDAHWNSQDFWSPFSQEINAEHFLAAIDGENHSRLRKITKKAYSREFVLGQLPELVSITQQQIDGWQPGQTVVVHPFIQHMVAEQIGQLVLGRGPGEYLGDFVIFMRALLNVVTGQQSKRTLKSAKYLRAKSRVMELARQLLDRPNPRNLTDEQADLIDYLLRAQKDNRDLLAEPEMLIAAVGPYLAGIDTSAGTISFTLYALLKYSQWLPDVVAEIDHAFQDDGLTAQKFRAMPALHAAVTEAMRRYPIAPVLQRTVTQPFEFAGYQVNTGTTVMVGTGVAHFDSHIYTQPKVYDPSRCREPRNEHKKPGAYAPFGAGAHTCAGAGFAEVQVAASIATLLHTFEFELASDSYEIRTIYNPAPAPDSKFQVRIKSKRVQSS